MFDGHAAAIEPPFDARLRRHTPRRHAAAMTPSSPLSFMDEAAIFHSTDTPPIRLPDITDTPDVSLIRH